MTERTRARLDRFINKVISRKLLVWMTASIGLATRVIDGDQWLAISIVYVGSQAASDFIVQYTKARFSGNQEPLA